MKTTLAVLLILTMIQQSIFSLAYADRSYTPPPAPVINTGLSNRYGPGTALAAASGTCVKDWNVGWQKCISWAMVDPEGIDAVHGFGGGLTTRLDQFSIHFWGGIEDISGDETTILFTGSINFR